MPTIIIDDHIPFIKGVLEPFARVIYEKGEVIDRQAALSADGLIIRTRTRCDKELLEGTPVKFIATATIGFDHIDKEYCKSHKISWHHSPGCNAGSVQQYIASVLANLPVKHGFSLKNKRIGIVGVGHVGSKVLRLAKLLGMIPVVNDPPRQRNELNSGFVSLEEICETCDIITFHVPLNRKGIDKTFHLADKKFFNGLSRKPVIINTSRGEVVETKAVKEALSTGMISGFVADVWENEPFPDPALLQASLIATPHIAGYSVEGKANGTAICVSAASQFFGFGLDNWHPPALPQAVHPEIRIDGMGKSEEQIITEAILASYDVANDDHIFRQDPSRFEDLRNHYGIRREFEAFCVNVRNARPDIIMRLKELGFQLLNIEVRSQKSEVRRQKSEDRR